MKAIVRERDNSSSSRIVVHDGDLITGKCSSVCRTISSRRNSIYSRRQDAFRSDRERLKSSYRGNFVDCTVKNNEFRSKSSEDTVSENVLENTSISQSRGDP
jgi:hypothetical protein